MGNLHRIPRRNLAYRVGRDALIVAAFAGAAYGLNVLGNDSHAALRPVVAPAASAHGTPAAPASRTPATTDDADYFPRHYQLHATEPAEPLATF